MKYVLEIDGSEMDAFEDIFAAGIHINSRYKVSRPEARLIRKAAKIATKYENDRLAGVK